MTDEHDIELLMERLYEICQELGWVVSIDNSDTHVGGMLIGRMSYIENILANKEKFSDYVVLATDEEPTQVH